MAKVELKSLVKDYRDGKQLVVRAVNNLDLIIEDGEFMVLVGPSGCGKSTTLRMIAGLEEITEGSISIGSKPISGSRLTCWPSTHTVTIPGTSARSSTSRGVPVTWPSRRCA